MAGEEPIDAELESLLEPEVRKLTAAEQKVLDESLDESDAVEEELTNAAKLKIKAKASNSPRETASTMKPRVLPSRKSAKAQKRSSKKLATTRTKKKAKVAATPKTIDEPPPTPIPLMTKEEKKELLNPKVVSKPKNQKRSLRPRNVVRIDFKEK